VSCVLGLETAAPLIGITAASAALGLGVAADILHVSHIPWHAPAANYWWTLGGGLACALAVALAATIPLARMTSLESARFE
jgi:hypothetical protein